MAMEPSWKWSCSQIEPWLLRENLKLMRDCCRTEPHPDVSLLNLLISHPGRLSCFRKPVHSEDTKWSISNSRVPEWVNMWTGSGNQGRAGSLSARDQDNRGVVEGPNNDGITKLFLINEYIFMPFFWRSGSVWISRNSSNSTASTVLIPHPKLWWKQHPNTLKMRIHQYQYYTSFYSKGQSCIVWE